MHLKEFSVACRCFSKLRMERNCMEFCYFSRIPMCCARRRFGSLLTEMVIVGFHLHTFLFFELIEFSCGLYNEIFGIIVISLVFPSSVNS